MIYDFIGIGIGPFNLGLAALSDDLPSLKTLFFEKEPGFNWHTGMMLDGARLQVPFYADLATVVNPRSRYTYLNFLKEKKRLFRFAILENNFIRRSEYNDYCQWVAGHLDNLRFGHTVTDVAYDEGEELYEVWVTNHSGTAISYHAKRIVIGIGTQPVVPACAKPFLKGSSGISTPLVFHSADYLDHKDLLLQQKDITLVGSGQSAAEIFYDLLLISERFTSLNWFTRSSRFFPMDYSKFALEMTSLDYIDHFYSLAPGKKAEVLSDQASLYKGINFSLIDDIYRLLHEKFDGQERRNVFLHPACILRDMHVAGKDLQLRFHHRELGKSFVHHTGTCILATGYTPALPAFLNSVKERIVWTPDGDYAVNRNYSIDHRGEEIFVQNAEMHTHGFSAPDLGMGPYRNATILNTILGYEHFSLERSVAFQSFGCCS